MGDCNLTTHSHNVAHSQFLYVSLGAMLPEIRGSGGAGHGHSHGGGPSASRGAQHSRSHAHSLRRTQDQHEAPARPAGALALLDLLAQHAGLLSGFGLLLLVSLSKFYIEALFDNQRR